MAQSWEFYQQPESGTSIPYALWWICGLGTARQGGTSGLQSLTVGPNTIWAVPWNQMRDVTVSKMMIHVLQGQSGARCRLGIYQNLSNTNNVPNQLVLDAGEIDLGTTGIKTLSVNQALGADTRYWAVLQSNNGGPSQIAGLTLGMVIFWGAYNVSNTFNVATGLLLSNQTYGTGLPGSFPSVTASNLSVANMPAIALAFSAVT